MSARTWFKHRCWFCGHVSRDVVFIVGDSDYQCTDRQACQARRDHGAEPCADPGCPCCTGGGA